MNSKKKKGHIMSVSSLRDKAILMAMVWVPFVLIFDNSSFKGLLWGTWGIALLSHISIELFDL